MTVEHLPELALSCLGTPAARVAGGEPPREVLWRTHFALLTYLALSADHTRARNHLVGLLWPEKPEDNARRSLNEAVHRLRALLGEERLITHGESLRLNAHGLVVDALDFESACNNGELRALELLRGEFLEGLHVDDAPGFDAWMESQRRRIRERATQLLLTRAEEQLAINRYVEARALAVRALTIEPIHEPAASVAMRSAALDGDPAGSLVIYHEFSAAIERELGEQPSEQLRGLAARVRAGTWQRGGARHASSRPPLVGRRDAHARLFTTLEHITSNSRCGIVIAGDASSGRTRLLDGCAERLALRGATVATARLLESDHDARWSTLRTLMRGGLADAPGIAGTDHLGLRALAGIVPELAVRVSPLDAPDAAQIADGMTSLLAAVGEERLTALLIDDAQWADRATLALLRAVWTLKAEIPFVLAVTVERGAPISAECQELVAVLGRDASGLEIQLDPLARDDLLALIEALAPWCTRPDDRARLARRIEQESGGNPFLAVTLLRDLAQAAARDGHSQWPEAGATHDAPLPITLPGAARSAIAARVARLDDDSMAVLRSASVAGEVVEPWLITEILDLPRSRIDEAIDRLERERLVMFDGNRYAFYGRLVPAVIERECIQPGGRRRLRERCIAALADRTELEWQLLRARLLAAEGRPEAFDAAMRVAERALAIGATRTHATALRIAEAAAAGDRGRLDLLPNVGRDTPESRSPIAV